MYLDLEDYRPDTPRVNRAISVREGILLSLLAHAVGVIVWLLAPPVSRVVPVPIPDQRDQIQFVSMLPAVDMKSLPKPHVEQSDQDRRATSPIPAPEPDRPPPSRGDTPEKVVGAPTTPEKPLCPDVPNPAPPTTTSPPPDLGSRAASEVPSNMLKPSGGLGNSLRNLQQFLQTQSFDNPQGGQSDQGADIQFDSKGIDFGPWIRRFIAQVKRNWFVPQAAMLLKGHVVIQFNVLRNGTLTDIKIVQKSGIDAFDIAAFNSLKLSNPTMVLPPDYPDDKVLFTVTFHYNERDR